VKPKKRQKLCYCCEGEVDLDVIVCPFCAADLREEKPELSRNSFGATASFVKPLRTETNAYQPLYEKAEEEVPIQENITTRILPTLKEEGNESVLLPVGLLSVGAHLFMLGLALLLLSDHGVLVLKWNAKYWILYMIASIPLFFFGLRSITKE
jgi:hypothetical protein